ncbi:uncharacterized protein LOC117505857 [Thalassophryne amazonica]|uniref:uncharacterized protein LOC117505857 n=1 Tax=Thalassophryne amazonica TaxID=390379 RepID=UPI001471EF7A|nr:uncharacterized protein LOC117505857 [Thalassophryne amazonica]
MQRKQRPQTVPETAAHDHTANERMFTILEKIIERLDYHEQLLLQIAERQQVALPVDVEFGEETVLPPLPCESREALQELNTLLETSHAARKQLVRIISLVGETGQAVCANALKKIVGHEVSKTYNLMGTKGKASFAELRSLHAAVTEGIRTNNGMQDTSDRDIANWAGRWFTNARDRQGDRQARRQANTAQKSPARYENYRL